MNAVFDHLVIGLGWALVRFVWQGALLACLTALLLALLRNGRPQLRYLVASLALGLCVMLPLFDVWQVLHTEQSGPAPLADVSAGEVVSESLVDGLPGLLGRNLRFLVLTWAAGSMVFAIRLGMGLAWIARIDGSGVADPRLQVMLDGLAARLGVVKAVRLRVTAGLSSPVVFGIWQATVLVPASLVTGMQPDMLEALLAHELVHVRRHDYLINLLQNLVEILLFYHPAVWWISRRIRIERELIADALAAQAIGEPRRLALALSELEKMRVAHSGLAQAANGGILVQRIKNLVSPQAQALNWKAAIPALIMVLTGFAGYVQAAGDVPASGSGQTAGNAPELPYREKAQFADLLACRPIYPPDLKAQGVEGTVALQFTVGVNGKVKHSVLTRSSGNDKLDESTRADLAKCVFYPAMRDGKAIESEVPVIYVWKLEN